MAETTISLTTEAYERLKNATPPGGSFSDVILEYVRPPAITAGDLLNDLHEIRGRSFVDEDLMKQVETGRKRPRKTDAP